MSEADLEAWLAERFEAEPAQAPDVPFDLSPAVVPGPRSAERALRRALPLLCAVGMLAIAVLGQVGAIDAVRLLHAPLLAPEPQWLRALLGPVDSVAGVLATILLVLRAGWRWLLR